MERGDLAEFGKKRNTDDDFLPIENVGRKIIRKNYREKIHCLTTQILIEGPL